MWGKKSERRCSEQRWKEGSMRTEKEEVLLKYCYAVTVQTAWHARCREEPLDCRSHAQRHACHAAARAW